MTYELEIFYPLGGFGKRHKFFDYSLREVVHIIREQGWNRQGRELWLFDSKSNVLAHKPDTSTRFQWMKK